MFQIKVHLCIVNIICTYLQTQLQYLFYTITLAKGTYKYFWVHISKNENHSMDLQGDASKQCNLVDINVCLPQVYYQEIIFCLQALHDVKIILCIQWVAKQSELYFFQGIIRVLFKKALLTPRFWTSPINICRQYFSFQNRLLT